MFQETKKGFFIHIDVVPNAACSEIVGKENDRLKIRIAAVPEKGKVNAIVVAILAARLKIGKSQVKITSGLTSRHKKVCIEGIEPDEIRAKLQ